MASSGGINQHKRLAMGRPVNNSYAKGGRVSVVGAGPMVPKPSGSSQSSLTTSRRNNGVPGMCAGGKMKKK